MFIQEDYLKRAIVLRSLGFNSYRSYLRSTLWDTIRKEVLVRDSCNCRVLSCKRGKGVKEVHHLSYSREVLLGLDTAPLVTLCSKCHEFVEYNGKGKLSLMRSRAKTLKLIGNVTTKKGANRWLRIQRQFSLATTSRILSRLEKSYPNWYRLAKKG